MNLNELENNGNKNKPLLIVTIAHKQRYSYIDGSSNRTTFNFNSRRQ